jgi:hypothetical protein
MYFLLSNACELDLSGAVEQWTGVPAQCIRAYKDHVMIASAFCCGIHGCQVVRATDEAIFHPAVVLYEETVQTKTV